MRRFLAIAALLFLCLEASGQKMQVVSFRCLENDMDARSVYPVNDLNGRKAALIKVVTTATGFDFDIGLLGVTAVRQEPGEIWVYVPEKAYKITVRHNSFGVLRDYVFPLEIQSATVYEMVLSVLETVPAATDTVYVVKEVRQEVPVAAETPQELPAPSLQDKPLRLHIIPVVTPYPAFTGGLMAGLCRRAGGYLKLRTTFSNVTTDKACDAYGWGDDGYVWASGESAVNRLAATAGVMVPALDWFTLYAGAGYGSRDWFWKDMTGNWVKVTDYSFSGVTAEIGAVLSFGRFDLLLGATTTSFKYTELELGAGIRF